MPTTLNVVQALDFPTYSTHLHMRVAAGANPLWFRGCGSHTYRLIPSLYRHPTTTNPGDLLSLEARMLERFRQRSLPFHDRRLDDDWECLFFMQHFGVPTRLLDWSENPFIALFFAITSAEKTAAKYKQDAAVWILDPSAWNRAALAHITYNSGPLSPKQDALNGHKPGTDLSVMNRFPVALFGTHNSPRIVAQRGVFTIFGKEVTSMEDCYRDESFPQECLEKVTIPVNAISKLLNELTLLGYTDSVVYPDLPGLALELKRYYDF